MLQGLHLQLTPSQQRGNCAGRKEAPPHRPRKSRIISGTSYGNRAKPVTSWSRGEQTKTDITQQVGGPDGLGLVAAGGGVFSHQRISAIFGRIPSHGELIVARLPREEEGREQLVRSHARNQLTSRVQEELLP